VRFEIHVSSGRGEVRVRVRVRVIKTVVEWRLTTKKTVNAQYLDWTPQKNNSHIINK
jgi:hypothetical protein